ncbi:TonB-dependent receptor [Gammaproteobacteria bacterium]|nr:TonB-dependent receptor [Gammaproteobacteria bacterium]MDA9129558.1 TonB-dependent receptor [Gammaproteobacteria bacterium]MDA9350928.1 TonB-dependent receptor [Gammaproteobacteria bacterium]MDC1423301.1 TonB-dependent receptor [Gammaproteobacteria bacterium]MDC1511557.1 TonB-dependent receptor [Gammaproteobacteria bacterium]
MRHSRKSLALALAIATPLAGQTFAQERQRIEEITVVGVRDTHTVIVDDTLVATPDTAQLLRKMPGANVNKNGELTGIAQYRGMFGDRIQVSVDGAQINGAGPNAMDAPLHYAPVAILESLTINRGIVPVSKGQETIGGYVEANTYAGDFGTTKGFEFSGRAYAGAQSVNSGDVLSGFFSVANDTHIFRGFVMQERADDLEFPDGNITPSEYERERFDLGYSFVTGAHEFSIDFARNNTKDAGTASLPMDILSIDSDLFRSRYTFSASEGVFTVELSASDNEHWMTNYHLRRPPQTAASTADPMRFRRNWAVSENYGFALKYEQFADNGNWLYGIDGHFAEHRSIITNPNSTPFYISNFNDVNRDIIGAFVERQISLNARTGLETGIRVNHVSMDSVPVSANLNPMNMMMGMPVMMNNLAGSLSTQFNNDNVAQTDTNVDAFVRLSYQTDGDATWYIGAARKTRSPSYQERYLWIPLEATGGLADGKTYIGNPNLNPEVAHEIELGLDLENSRYGIYPRIFYKRVSDYIQGTPSTNVTANNFAQMMANMGMGMPNPLQFTNVEARFYGLDIDSNFSINDKITLRAILNIVRADRRDINDNLYRVSPDNVLVALDYRGNGWTGSIESVTYADQNRIAITNSELKTEGYSLVNVMARSSLADGVEVSIGAENLLDESYLDHLAAYNRAYNPDIASRARMPGLGRNFYARVMWNF